LKKETVASDKLMTDLRPFLLTKTGIL